MKRNGTVFSALMVLASAGAILTASGCCHPARCEEDPAVADGRRAASTVACGKNDCGTKECGKCHKPGCDGHCDERPVKVVEVQKPCNKTEIVYIDGQKVRTTIGANVKGVINVTTYTKDCATGKQCPGSVAVLPVDKTVEMEVDTDVGPFGIPIQIECRPDLKPCSEPEQKPAPKESAATPAPAAPPAKPAEPTK